MADPLAEEAEAASRKVLAIGAQTGQAGVDAYNAAQAQLAADRQRAVAGAKASVSQIGGPQGLDFDALINRPADQISSVLTADKARFQAQNAGTGYDAAGYFGKVGSLGSALAALAAANAAGSGGGGSGGGGSGGGGGGGKAEKPMTDTELRTRLTGAAQAVRAENVAGAAGYHKAATKVRNVKGQKVRQVTVKAKQTQKLANRLVKRLEDQPNNKKLAKRAVNVAQRAALLQVRAGKLKAEQVGRVGTQRETYRGVLRAGRQNLGEIAREIGTAATEDPERVAGLIGPTQDKAFALADRDRTKELGGTLGEYGQVPQYGAFGAASQLGIPVKKVKLMKRSPHYSTLSGAARAAIEAGDTYDSFARGLDSWRLPHDIETKKGKIKRHPGYKNLVDLVLLEYGPAFTR